MKQPKMFTQKIAILFLILLGLVAYFNAFQNQFLWDDDFLIVKNDCVKAWSHWWHHFALDLYHSYSNYYRPIQMLTYNIDYSFWKLNPFGYHLTNLFFHVLAAILMFTFVARFTKDKRIAFVSSAIYAVHPLNIESVTYISGRADSLMAVFLLSSIILFDIHFKKEGLKAVLIYSASLISMALALLSKESAIVFPLVIFIYALIFKEKKEIEHSKKIIKFYYLSLFIVIAVVYAILRVVALNFLDEPLIKSTFPFYLRMLTGIKAIFGYIVLIFFPIRLHMERSMPVVNSIFGIPEIISIVLILALIALAIKFFSSNKVVSFSLFWFFINLLPVSGIFPLQANMSEHWLYVALMGFLVFIAFYLIKLWDSAKKLRPIFFIVFIVILSLFTARTLLRNSDWSDKMKFYKNTLKYNPNSVKVLNNLGNAYLGLSDFDNALRLYRKALLIESKDYRTYLNIGICYFRMDKLNKAEEMLKKSVTLKPNFAKSHYNLGILYEKLNDKASAIKEYKVAIENNAFYLEAYNNLGNVYFDRGDDLLAKGCYKKVVEINSNLAGPYNNLGNIYSKTGSINSSIEMYKKAIKMDSQNGDFYLNLGVSYGASKEILKAENAFKQAISLNPRMVNAHINLGICYYYLGQKTLAEKEWAIVLFLDPENSLAKQYLEKGL